MAARSADIAGVAKVQLNATEVEMIKNRAVILTSDTIKDLKHDHELQLSATRHESQERKRKMMEKELAVRARREQTAMEMEMENERKALLTGDEVLRNQHLTSIRRINSLALQASGYKLCDELQEHKKGREQMEAKYDRIHDSIMERERMTELQVRKEREAEAQQKRLETRRMLEQQIAEREKKAIWKEEAKAVEAQKILNTYKQYEAEEKRNIEQQVERKRDVMAAVAETNERIKVMKADAARREKQEEVAVAAYLRKKAVEEEAKAKEEQRIRKSKELRVAKLRAQQEKAQDKQAMQDEFRAKKASEEAEKSMRDKERRDREAKEALSLTISRDRKRQESFHDEHKRQQRQLDLHMDAIAQVHVEQEFQHQRAALQAAKERELQHGQVLLQQIEGNAARRTKAKLFEQDDAKFLKKKATRESILAEKVRQDALRKLQRQGVPEEYLRELRTMQINEANAEL
ncbi:hypothetical protein PybrP1_001096 [[Pythium] brassicae (nom. inval.)]|nr:hypothetical protein PybrP1_001096 [[Pythium] brassicae (nom. inval.)]